MGRIHIRTAGLQHGPSRRDLYGGHASPVHHHEPIAVPAVQHAGLLRERRGDVIDHLRLVGMIRSFVRDVHAVTTD